MSKVVLVCNHKGGVGKTMLAAHLAGFSSALKVDAKGRKLRTVAIDTDAQMSLTRWSTRSQEGGYGFPEVVLLRPSLLRSEWPDLVKRYDRIVIDTPPTTTHVIEEYGPIADVIVVPVTPGGFELAALPSTLGAIPINKVRFVLNRAKETNVCQKVRKVLEDLGQPLNIVRDYAAFAETALSGGTVLDRYPSGNPALDVRHLCHEVWH